MRDPAEPLSPSTAQILVAVVMEAFEAGSEVSGDSGGPFKLTPNTMENYLHVWNAVDINGTQFLGANDIVQLLTRLDFPLGLRGDKRLAGIVKGGPGGDEKVEARLRLAARNVFKVLPLAPNADGKFHFRKCRNPHHTSHTRTPSATIPALHPARRACL